MDPKPLKKPLPAVVLAACDILLIGAALCVFALFHHVLPRAYAVEGAGSRANAPGTMAAAFATTAGPARPEPDEETPRAAVLGLEQQEEAACAAAGPAQISENEEACGVAGPVQPLRDEETRPGAQPAQTSADGAAPSEVLPAPSAIDEETWAETRQARVARNRAVPPGAAPAQTSTQDTPYPGAGSGKDDSGAAEASENPSPVGGKFAGKFTGGEVITTANTYMSPNVNVTLTQTQREGVTYYIQDIYIRDIDNLRTAFARNTYGRAILESAPDMAAANAAIAAINGDHYGIGSSGVVIRNGVPYTDKPDAEVCVLFYDGSMRIVPAADFDAEASMAAGAYQAWTFGPSLLTDDGKAMSSFRSRVSGLNPRTAIGYYEPGHYLFVVVDGRQSGYSNGMTLAQLSSLFEELGVKLAYNLDGGQTSVMTFEGRLVNRPARGGRMTTDIVYIAE